MTKKTNDNKNNVSAHIKHMLEKIYRMSTGNVPNDKIIERMANPIQNERIYKITNQETTPRPS